MDIKIKEPCSENWGSMQIGLNSRHCQKCEKNVIDFTKKTRVEIIEYLINNKATTTCGRLRADQFDFRHEDIPILIESFRKNKTPNAFLILAIVSLSLASCKNEPLPVSPQQPNTNKVKTEQTIATDTIKDTNRTSSKDTIKDKIELNKKAHKTLEIKEPVIPIDPPIYMGDVCIIEPDTLEPDIAVFEPEPENKNLVVGMVAPEVIEPEINEDVYNIVEKMPEFPGGIDELYKFISNEIVYPKYEEDNKIEGTVYVRFVVMKNGKIASPKILKSVPNSINFDKEVHRVIELMPKWIPGETHGKKVNVEFTLPISFRLR